MNICAAKSGMEVSLEVKLLNHLLAAVPQAWLVICRGISLEVKLLICLLAAVT